MPGKASQSWQKEGETIKRQEAPTFGTFNGVFVPTFLSIIGVILYLRLGYIVGSGGILPTIVIILLASSITFCTGLSISSITTNIRISAGGAYSIISKTLGLEVGGSVGIPLYLAQIFSVTLYIFGFSEAWKFIFPDHPTLLIIFASFLAVFLLTFISTKIAIKTQFLVFLIVVVSLVSVFLNTSWLRSVATVQLIGGFPHSFWSLFALFFPAVTGILAGIGMSGELKDPKKQIPKGMISAILITVAIYVATALWLGYTAAPDQLMNNKSIMIDLAAFGPLVLAGILAATLSSALTTFIAAPRLLQAMAEKSMFPGSKYVVAMGKRGIPHRAVLFSAIPIFLTLYLANLDLIAPVITMFFLITYAIINIVVFVEQSIGLVSFRPTLTIPRFVPLFGAVGSIIMMFFINSLAGMIALLFVFFSYLWLVKRRLVSKEGDIRSGLFITFSEWAARKVLTLPESTKHIWKPNVLLPVVNTSTLLGNFPLIKSLTFPNGTMTVLGLKIKRQSTSPEQPGERRENLLRELPVLINKFGQEGIFTSHSTVTAPNYTDAVCISMEAIEGQAFPPNILFLPFKVKRLPVKSLARIFKVAKKHNFGIVLSDRDRDVGLGSQEDIHVWIDPCALDKDIFSERRFDLGLLIAYRLYRNWAGKIHLWMCVPKERKQEAEKYLQRLVYESRFPHSTKIIVSTETFQKTLKLAPTGDIHIIPVTNYTDIGMIRKISESEEKSFFFVADSGKEDVLA
ncbi:TPA: Na-K-Cl cotransporter [Candidatus Woesearchaeota archaeon]|nr:Na-K-Cl cotransporter [Candidatus Woesearchaeota archaeon]